MKRMAIVFLAVVLMMSTLSACNILNPFGRRVPKNDQSPTAASQSAATENPTESATEKATEAQIGTLNEYVQTIKEKTVDFGDGSSSTLRIPAILLGGSDAVAANAEIMEKFGSVFDDDKGTGGAYGLDYEAYLNDKVLSIVIMAKYDGGNSYGLCYNFDVLTAKRLDNSTLCDYRKIKYSDALDTLSSNLNEYYLDKYSTMPGNDDMKKKTLSEDNLKEADMYVDGAGKLMALTDIYAAVGGGHWIVQLSAQ